jgi:hypothetical protein
LKGGGEKIRSFPEGVRQAKIIILVHLTAAELVIKEAVQSFSAGLAKRIVAAKEFVPLSRNWRRGYLLPKLRNFF